MDDKWEQIGATVRKAEKRLVVNINQEHQDKAGIVSLTCEFKSGLDIPSSQDGVGVSTIPPSNSTRRLNELEKDYKEQEEILQTLKRRRLKLAKREAWFGKNFSIEDEMALEDVVKEICKMEEALLLLDAKIREEKIKSSPEVYPYAK